MPATIAPLPSIADNLAAVNDRVARATARAGRAPGTVRLIAVSKNKPPAAVMEAYRAGQMLFGENRVQEAVIKMENIAKMGAVGEGPVWHLIGHLQGNKARHVPGRFAAVHSVDSDRIAQALERPAAAAGIRLGVLIQLNLHGEATKAGVTDEATLRRLAESVMDCTHLELTGLMTIPPPSLSEAETRALYARVRGLHAGLKSELSLGAEFCELSFGMSHDFEWAIEEGATMVRVGTAIFGERP